VSVPVQLRRQTDGHDSRPSFGQEGSRQALVFTTDHHYHIPKRPPPPSLRDMHILTSIGPPTAAPSTCHHVTPQATRGGACHHCAPFARKQFWHVACSSAEMSWDSARWKSSRLGCAIHKNVGGSIGSRKFCFLAYMAQPNFRGAPGRRPLPRFLANIGIVVPVLPDEEDVEDAGLEEESSSATSSLETPDSSVVSETDSDASAGDRDFSEAWIWAIESATDMESDEHLRFLLMELRKQRNHFPPSDPPPSPPPRDREPQRQHPRRRAAQAPAIAVHNAFQALAMADDETDEPEEDDANPPTTRSSSASTRVQCRYLKVMIKFSISDVRRRNARSLFEQKCWSDAADLFVTAHDQLFEVVVSSSPDCFRCSVSL
jgi:hypothetical protein